MNKISRMEVFQVVGLAIFWVIIINNPTAFFIGLRIAPIDTVTEILGLIFIPTIPTYFLAKFLALKFNWSTYRTWMILCITLLALITIGKYRGSEKGMFNGNCEGWWDGRSFSQEHRFELESKVGDIIVPYELQRNGKVIATFVLPQSVPKNVAQDIINANAETFMMRYCK